MFAMKKVVVFGGSGFLGSHVVDELIKRGYEVRVCDIVKSKYIKDKLFYKCDILDFEQIKKAIEGFDVIYNFAGLADINVAIKEPLKTIKLNILGNTNILEAMKEQGIKKFFYASSAYVFSNKGSFYGISKQASEKIIEEYANLFGIEYIIIRYGSVYGPRADKQNRIYRILKEAIDKKKITFLGDGEEVREYIHVRDAAKLSVDLLENNYKNEHFILTGIEKHSYKELLKLIKEIFDNKIDIEFKNQEYKGHYKYTPYSINEPKTGKKIINNPYIDFGQGLLELIYEIKRENSV
jgi:UDP-glucose 4-epimerase